MNHRERLMATLRGEPVDRPPVNFYEINGLDEDPFNPDPFNIYNHPSWQLLLALARERTDRIVMRKIPVIANSPDPLQEHAQLETFYLDGSRFTRRTLRIGARVLTSLSRRDPDVNTTWVVEHLVKDLDDLAALLNLPVPVFDGRIDPQPVLEVEQQLGDSGIVMLDTPDPLCLAAELFHMSDFTVVALTEPHLFHRLLERYASFINSRTAAASSSLPGRLWRIYGPEYATPPYLPPRLFREYVTRYDRILVESIQGSGGFARLHSHGKISQVLDAIAKTGCAGLDPIEPPPQGDVELEFIRARYGRQWVLFGNLEASDIENLPTPQFAQKIHAALKAGTSGTGQGFVLMPSACPYGRMLSPLALANYRQMVDEVENFEN